MDWSNDRILEFISNYETEPILWNPRETGHKRKDLCYDAWMRIKNNLSWACTVEDLKKKRDSLMAYYRQHLNKKKKSIKSGAGTDEVYHVNWFAFSALHSFLQPIYDCKQTIHTQVTEDDEQGMTTVAVEESTSRAGGDANTQQAKRARYDLSSEIKTARQQMNEAFNLVKNTEYDEYEFFGKLIASKIRKIQNPNVKEILMNDIQNIVFKAYIVDRLNEPTAVLPHSFLQTNNLPHQSSQSPYSPQLQSPQSPYSQQHQSPQSPNSQQHQPPPSPYSQQHESPQSPYSQQHQSPQSPNSQQHQPPPSPYSQQHESPQSPYSHQHHPSQSPYSHQHHPSQSPYTQQHQSPSHNEPYHSLLISKPSTSFQSVDQNSFPVQNTRVLPPRKASRIIISETGEITFAD